MGSYFGAQNKPPIRNLKKKLSDFYPATELRRMLRCFFIDESNKTFADVSRCPVAQTPEFDSRPTTVEGEVELAAS